MNQVGVKLLKKFNKTKFRKEKSLIQSILLNPQGDKELNDIIIKNLDLITTYKGIMILFEQKWLQIDRKLLVSKLQIEFDSKAKYGFNVSNEIFLKFLLRVNEQGLWTSDFDLWLNEYIKRNANRMTISYQDSLQQILINNGISDKYVTLLEENVKEFKMNLKLI